MAPTPGQSYLIFEDIKTEIQSLRKSNILYPVFIILFLSTVGCSTKWTKAIQYGHIAQNKFKGQVDIEIQQGLIFVPVFIQGKKYRFLFDSGAPLSISNQLQKEFDFKLISKGNIRDSDDNRKQVNWVRVDSLNIGGVVFLDQTAFIGDFEANSLLECLDIDGIIGSNLMRQCNWTIDQIKEILILNDKTEGQAHKDGFIIPFNTDHQYNIFINIAVGQATLRNILVDYGSNGSISLSNEIFEVLRSRKIIDKSMTEEGIQQSGIVGKSIALNRELVFSDSVRLDSNQLKNVKIQTGKTSSIGNKFLSRFNITIDWKNKHLYLRPSEKTQDSILFSGFRLGYTDSQGIYVQSVIRNSEAYKKGVRPFMKVSKLDRLDFEAAHDFCDYVNHTLGQKVFLELIDSAGVKKEHHFEQTAL